ncbi:MAG: RagB/SusD family nutrient uptake outer membrane protein [Bacteroides nordii]
MIIVNLVSINLSYGNMAEFAGKVYDQVNQKDLYDPSREYRSGYFRCKGINPDLTTADFEVNADGANFAYFRYAEVLLMYAEAKIEQNQIDDQVLKAINDVRVRAGIPTLQDTYDKTSFEQNELRDILRRERRIEFAFECKRYWDLIRWRTAEIVLNEPYYGMTVMVRTHFSKLLPSTKIVVISFQFIHRGYR